MKLYNKNILIWIIVILAVTNISTVGTIIYQAYFQQTISQNIQFEQIEIPNSHLGRFFRDELNLSKEQHFLIVYHLLIVSPVDMRVYS